MISVERYVEQQKERLEQIRQATEKEKQLLHQHRTTTSAAQQNRRRDASPPPFAADSSLQSLRDHKEGNYDSDEPQSLLQSLAFGPAPSAGAASLLQDRAAEVQAKDEELRREEAAQQTLEANIERRLQKVNLVKKELLSRLVTLQYREKEQKDSEAVLDVELAELNAKIDEVRDRNREIQHQRGVQATELAQREATLAGARKKLQDKALEQQRAVNRMRQQTIELEDRVRGLELQQATRQRAVEDLEREVMHHEMRLRDEELQAANELRQDIERRQMNFLHQQPPPGR